MPDPCSRPLEGLDRAQCAELHALVANADDLHMAADAVRTWAADSGVDGGLLQALADGLDYMLSSDDNKSTPYAPVIEWADGRSHPLRLELTSPQRHEQWAVLLEHLAEHVTVSARLADLLWCVRAKPRPDLRARLANEQMRAAGAPSATLSIDAVDGLVRALTIAREISDRALIEPTARDLVAAAKVALAEDPGSPGVSMALVEALTTLPKDQQPTEVDALLAQAADVFDGDVFVLDSVLKLQMARTAPGSEREEAARRAVAAWRQAATERPGLVGLTFLEKALDLAVAEGIHPEASDIRSELLIPRSPETLGMERVSSETEIDREEWDAFVVQLVGTTGGMNALDRLAQQNPVGDPEEEESATRARMKQFPLQHLFTRVISNAEGLPLAHVETEEQKFRYARIENRSMGISLWAIALTDALRLASERSLVTPDDLRAFADTELIGPDVALGAQAAFEHYLAGRYEEAALMLLPRLERIMRAAARSVGLDVYTEPKLDGTRQGQYKGMGALLTSLRGVVPEADRQYLLTLLSDSLGPNLRNEILHGLHTQVTERDAGLILHAVLMAATWRRTNDESL